MSARTSRFAIATATVVVLALSTFTIPAVAHVAP